MKGIFDLLRPVACALLASLAGSASGQQPALTQDDVLSLKDGRFYLDGRPFAEISFNKFDLFWQLWSEVEQGRELDDANPMVARQDKALRELKSLGFRTIRIFAVPWSGREFFEDPIRRTAYFKALDKTYELCDRNGMRVYACIGCGGFSEIPNHARKVDAGKEHLRELVANPESASRKLLYEYLDAMLARYKDRKTIVMWDISNELTNCADIMPGTRISRDQRMPTLKELAGFYNEVTAFIKQRDPLRLVTNGGSHLRESAWNLYCGNGWKADTVAEHLQAYQLIFGDTAIDVMDIHYYAVPTDGYLIQDGNGFPVLLNLKSYMEIARKIGKPMILGEYGALPHGDNPDGENAGKRLRPGWFESFEEKELASRWVQKAVDDLVDARVPITYWWCYQSDRKVEQNQPGRFDVSLDLNPEIVKVIADGNRRLQEKLLRRNH